MGRARRDALRTLGERTDVADVNTFVSAIVQSEQLGVSISKVLLTQADQMRVRRRQTRPVARRAAKPGGQRPQCGGLRPPPGRPALAALRGSADECGPESAPQRRPTIPGSRDDQPPPTTPASTRAAMRVGG